MSNEKLGVDKVEKVLKNVIDVFLQYEKAKEDDGRVSRMEMIGFADEALALGKSAVQFKAIKAQILDIDKEEGKELIDYVIAQGIIPEDVQIILAHAFAGIEKVIGAYQDDFVPIWNIIKKK